MYRTLMALSFCALAFAVEATAQEFKICTHDDNGKVTIRARCRANESAIRSAAALTRTQAWGFVRGDGSVDAARSSANLSARKLSTGLYCVRVNNISREQVLPVVTPDFSLSECTRNFPSIVSTVNSGCEADEFGIYNVCHTTEAVSDLAFSIVVP
jgi:hypothetical protein